MYESQKPTTPQHCSKAEDFHCPHSPSPSCPTSRRAVCLKEEGLGSWLQHVECADTTVGKEEFLAAYPELGHLPLASKSVLYLRGGVVAVNSMLVMGNKIFTCGITRGEICCEAFPHCC